MLSPTSRVLVAVFVDRKYAKVQWVRTHRALVDVHHYVDAGEASRSCHCKDGPIEEGCARKDCSQVVQAVKRYVEAHK